MKLTANQKLWLIESANIDNPEEELQKHIKSEKNKISAEKITLEKQRAALESLFEISPTLKKTKEHMVLEIEKNFQKIGNSEKNIKELEELGNSYGKAFDHFAISRERATMNLLQIKGNRLVKKTIDDEATKHIQNANEAGIELSEEDIKIIKKDLENTLDLPEGAQLVFDEKEENWLIANKQIIDKYNSKNKKTALEAMIDMGNGDLLISPSTETDKDQKSKKLIDAAFDTDIYSGLSWMSAFYREDVKILELCLSKLKNINKLVKSGKITITNKTQASEQLGAIVDGLNSCHIDVQKVFGVEKNITLNTLKNINITYIEQAIKIKKSFDIVNSIKYNLVEENKENIKYNTNKIRGILGDSEDNHQKSKKKEVLINSINENFEEFEDSMSNIIANTFGHTDIYIKAIYSVILLFAIGRKEKCTQSILTLFNIIFFQEHINKSQKLIDESKISNILYMFKNQSDHIARKIKSEDLADGAKIRVYHSINRVLNEAMQGFVLIYGQNKLRKSSKDLMGDYKELDVIKDDDKEDQLANGLYESIKNDIEDNKIIIGEDDTKKDIVISINNTKINNKEHKIIYISNIDDLIQIEKLRQQVQDAEGIDTAVAEEKVKKMLVSDVNFNDFDIIFPINSIILPCGLYIHDDGSMSIDGISEHSIINIIGESSYNKLRIIIYYHIKESMGKIDRRGLGNKIQEITGGSIDDIVITRDPRFVYDNKNIGEKGTKYIQYREGHTRMRVTRMTSEKALKNAQSLNTKGAKIKLHVYIFEKHQDPLIDKPTKKIEIGEKNYVDRLELKQDYEGQGYIVCFDTWVSEHKKQDQNKSDSGHFVAPTRIRLSKMTNVSDKVEKIAKINNEKPTNETDNSKSTNTKKEPSEAEKLSSRLATKIINYIKINNKLSKKQEKKLRDKIIRIGNKSWGIREFDLDRFVKEYSINIEDHQRKLIVELAIKNGRKKAE